MVTHPLQVEGRTAKDRRSKTDVLYTVPRSQPFKVRNVTDTQVGEKTHCQSAYVANGHLSHLFLVAAARSLCRRFLNQLPTCVGDRPVLSASWRLLAGLGYGSCRYDSRSRLRVRSLKQCDAACPVTDDVGGRRPPSTSFQMVGGGG